MNRHIGQNRMETRNTYTYFAANTRLGRHAWLGARRLTYSLLRVADTVTSDRHAAARGARAPARSRPSSPTTTPSGTALTSALALGATTMQRSSHTIGPPETRT